MTKSRFITTTPSQTKKLAYVLGEELRMVVNPTSHAFVVALEGELGSGKTLFTQGLGRGLGVRGKIHSPTFILMKRHPLKNSFFKNLWHVDCYRIRTIKELKTIGFHTILKDPLNIVVIEWANLVKKYIPKGSLKISIKHKTLKSRELIFNS